MGEGRLLKVQLGVCCVQMYGAFMCLAWVGNRDQKCGPGTTFAFKEV